MQDLLCSVRHPAIAMNATDLVLLCSVRQKQKPDNVALPCRKPKHQKQQSGMHLFLVVPM